MRSPWVMAAPPKILVVDDNQELVTLLGKLFEMEGWTPMPALLGQKGLELIRKSASSIDAAVVDILLPDMMGYEVAAELRRQSIPFVFMTGVFKGDRSVEEAKALYGAADYFEKPFEAQKLLEALRRLLPSSLPQTSDRPPPPPVESDFDFDFDISVEDDMLTKDPLEITGLVVVQEEDGVPPELRGIKLGAFVPPPLHQQPAIPASIIISNQLFDERHSPPAEGELRDNLPELITAFHLAQLTGELSVQKGKLKKTLYFERGRPCFAISNLTSERFGPFLVRLGRLNQEQLESLKQQIEASETRLGNLLVEQNLLKENEKRHYLGQQVRAIIYSLFAWEEGTYRMHFTDRAAGESEKVDLHPGNLILRGVKKLYRPERLFRLLSPEDRPLPSSDPSYDLHDLELEVWESQLLSRIDGSRTMAELAHIAKKPEAEVYGLVHGLVAVNILKRG